MHQMVRVKEQVMPTSNPYRVVAQSYLDECIIVRPLQTLILDYALDLFERYFFFQNLQDELVQLQYRQDICTRFTQCTLLRNVYCFYCAHVEGWEEQMSDECKGKCRQYVKDTKVDTILCTDRPEDPVTEDEVYDFEFDNVLWRLYPRVWANRCKDESIREAILV